MIKIALIGFVATEQIERSFNLGLAALLGEGVYNFGELVRDDNTGSNTSNSQYMPNQETYI